MSWALLAAGVALIVFAFYDLIKTTLGQGGGPMTNRVTALVWRLGLALLRRRRAHRLLTVAGVAGVLLVLVLWLALVWAGWTLIFSSSERAVVWSDSRRPATMHERSRFAGYALVTLGMGDFEPEGGIWKVCTALAAASGFSLLTLSLTYLTPLVGAATAKRQLGLYIGTIGRTPREILLGAWDGETFRDLEPHLQNLSPMITLLAQRHLTYPALHYFHAPRGAAAAPALAALDEALTLLGDACRPEQAPAATLLRSTRRAIWSLLTTLDNAYIEPAPEPPSPPEVASLAAAGLPLVDAAEVRRRLPHRSHRRRLLLAFVESDGWSWQDVVEAADESPGGRELGPGGAGGDEPGGE